MLQSSYKNRLPVAFSILVLAFACPISVIASATATYIGSDATTQGTWTGKYGSNGQVIANDMSNIPAYATMSFAGSSPYTWAASTTDPRALQKAGGSSSRIASTYYASPGFNINLNLTDGNLHKISLYLCDWDHASRVETISIFDPVSGALLYKQTFSSFAGGVYEIWSISGNVQIQVALSSEATRLSMLSSLTQPLRLNRRPYRLH